MKDQLLDTLQKTLTRFESTGLLLKEQQKILDSFAKHALESARLQIPTVSEWVADLKAQTVSELSGLRAQTASKWAGFNLLTSEVADVKVPTALKLPDFKMPPTIIEHLGVSKTMGVPAATAARDYLNSLTQTLRENLLVNFSPVNLADLTKYSGVTEFLRPLSHFEEQAKTMNVAALGYDAIHLTTFSAIQAVTEQFKFVQANVELHNQLFNSSLYHFLTDLDELNAEEFETEDERFKALFERIEKIFQPLLENIRNHPSDWVLRVGYHVLIALIYPLILFSLSASNQQVQQLEQKVDDVQQTVQETHTEIEEQNRRLEKIEKQLAALANPPNPLPEPKPLPPAEKETLYRLVEEVQVQAEPSEDSTPIMILVAGEIVRMLTWQGEWAKVQFFDYLHWELTTGWIQKSSLEHLMPRMLDSPRLFRTGQEVHPSLQFLAAKLHEVGIPLGEYVKEPIYRGLKIGFHRALVIDAKTRENLIAQDPASADLIRPWVRCRDLKKWQVDWVNRYVLMINPGTPLSQYPAIQRHLEPFREAWETRHSTTMQSGQWFELPATSVPVEVLQRPKIIYPARSATNQFALDNAGLIPSQKCGIIPSDDLYLLAILNSVLVTVWFRAMLPIAENLFMAKVSLMNYLPIAPATVAQKTPIIEQVKNLLTTPWTVGAIALEQEIDSLLFKLYDLTATEIAFLTEFQRPPLCGIWADLPEFDRDD